MCLCDVFRALINSLTKETIVVFYNYDVKKTHHSQLLIHNFRSGVCLNKLHSSKNQSLSWSNQRCQQLAEHRELISSWIVTPRQPHRVISGRIKHSQLLHIRSKRKAPKHKQKKKKKKRASVLANTTKPQKVSNNTSQYL